MHTEKWPERAWMRTWTVIHKALSRSEVSVQLRNNFEACHRTNKIDHAWQLNQTNNQSIIRKSHMSGPRQSPIYIAWINLTNPIISELWRFVILACVKIKRNRTLFRKRSGTKTVREKTWVFEIYLEIGVSKIIWRLEYWELNLRVGILGCQTWRKLEF